MNAWALNPTTAVQMHTEECKDGRISFTFSTGKEYDVNIWWHDDKADVTITKFKF